MRKDPVLVGAIAVVSAMMLSAIKDTFPHIFWGTLLTLLIYGCQRLVKQNGFLWKKK
tara:strand:- start:12031 stop:12201 length:171 start_codon:yes stop_codon:yes gene_type:complete